MEWTENYDNRLISLTKQLESVEEIEKYLPKFSPGSIMNRIKLLQRNGKIPKNAKIRMKNWNEDKLIKFALNGYSTIEISREFKGTNPGMIAARLSTLRAEGKLPKDFTISKTSKNNRNMKNKPQKSKTKKTSQINKQILNQPQSFLELNERLSRIEAIVIRSDGQHEKISGINELENIILDVSIDISSLKEKIQYLKNNEMILIRSKISAIERRMITLESLLDNINTELNFQKLMWAAFQKASEDNQSKELIHILKDVENIIGDNF